MLVFSALMLYLTRAVEEGGGGSRPLRSFCRYMYFTVIIRFAQI